MEYYSFSCVIILNQITMFSMMSRHILAPSNTYWLCSLAPGRKSVLLLGTKFLSRAFPVAGQGVPHRADPRLCHLRSEPKLRFKVVEKEWYWTFYVNRSSRSQERTPSHQSTLSLTPTTLTMAAQRGSSAGGGAAEALGIRCGSLEKQIPSLWAQALAQA